VLLVLQRISSYVGIVGCLYKILLNVGLYCLFVLGLKGFKYVFVFNFYLDGVFGKICVVFFLVDLWVV
jgi:hypothetical protein